jgi:hypothetical protein
MTQSSVSVIVNSASGKEVINKVFEVNNVRFSLQQFPAGIYMIQVNGVYAGKVVKD